MPAANTCRTPNGFQTSQTSACSEAEYVARAKSGDHDALTALFKSCSSQLKQSIAATGIAPVEIDEISTLAMTRAWKHMQTFDVNQNFQPGSVRLATTLLATALVRPREGLATLLRTIVFHIMARTDRKLEKILVTIP